MKIDCLPDQSFACALDWVGILGVAIVGVTQVVLTTVTSTVPAMNAGRESLSVQAVIGAGSGERFAIRSRPLRTSGR